MPWLPANVDEGIMFLGCLVDSSGQILLPRYLMNSLNGFVKTFRECSLATTDDLIGFQRSKVAVASGRRGGKSIYINAAAL